MAFHTAQIERDQALSKVPEVTLWFWIVKILCTTLGETGGDAVTMSMNLGYAAGVGIFAAIFAVAVWAQAYSKAFHFCSKNGDRRHFNAWNGARRFSTARWASAMRAE